MDCVTDDLQRIGNGAQGGDIGLGIGEAVDLKSDCALPEVDAAPELMIGSPDRGLDLSLPGMVDGRIPLRSKMETQGKGVESLFMSEMKSPWGASVYSGLLMPGITPTSLGVLVSKRSQNPRWTEKQRG